MHLAPIWHTTPASPLRYPGGKARLFPFVTTLIERNRLKGCRYIEPFAGGAGLALALLRASIVATVELNDYDRAIYAFWKSILGHTKEFVQRVRTTPLTIEEWDRQKAIHSNRAQSELFDLGFATFYLNRTNRSGILRAGVIGGRQQDGTFRIDARFDKTALIQRIEEIASRRSQIVISRRDAKRYIRNIDDANRCHTFVYLDPPYFHKGPDLYLNNYGAAEHQGVRDAIAALAVPWMVSYDDVSEIRTLYTSFAKRRCSLWYTADKTRLGREVLFFSRSLAIPRMSHAKPKIARSA